jgi:hypothetical protein
MLESSSQAPNTGKRCQWDVDHDECDIDARPRRPVDQERAPREEVAHEEQGADQTAAPFSHLAKAFVVQSIPLFDDYLLLANHTS